MAIKQIIAIGLSIIFLITFSYAAECNTKFYLYNFKFFDGNLEFLGKTLEKGCIPGNVYDKFYKFNLVKDNNIVYSYWFNPETMFTDVVDKEGNINGGIVLLKESKFSIPVPDVKYDEFNVLDKDDKKLVSLTPNQEKQKNQVQPFSLFDYVNNLMKATLGSLFK